MNQGSDTRSVQRAAFVVATTASFLMPFMGASANVAVPSIGEDLHMDAIALTWVATAFLLAAAVALLPAGRVADMVGRKRVFSLGTFVYTAASLLCGLSPSGDLLIAARVLQGIGASMIFGTGLAILTSVFPPGERGRAIGFNVAAVYMGLSLGPFVGGILVKHFGWRSVFLFNVPLGLAVLATIRMGLRGEWKAEARGGFDFWGAAIYAVSLVSLMYGVSLFPSQGGMIVACAALLGIVGFYLVERKHKAPLVDVSLFSHNHQFLFSNLAALVHYSATFGVTFLLSLYLQAARGFDPQEAGSILIAQPIMMALVSPFAGKISDRVQPRIVASTGMGLTCLSLAGMTFLGLTTPLVVVVGILALLGLGFALFSSPNTNAVMNSVGPASYGIASATVGTMRVLGQMVSMGIATLVLGQKVGRVHLEPGMYGSFVEGIRTIMLIFSVLCLIGIAFSAARGKRVVHPDQ